MSFVGEDTPVGGKERERGDRGLGGGGGNRKREIKLHLYKNVS